VVLVSVAIYLHSKYPYHDKAAAPPTTSAAGKKGKEAAPVLTAAAVAGASKGRKRD
jgi:hypothetical protein